MQNKEYWEKRSGQNVLDADKDAIKIAKKVEKIYLLAMEQIENDINRFYARFAVNNKISLRDAQKRLNPAELKAFHKQAKEYYDYAQANGWRNMYTKDALLLSAKAYMSRLEELKAKIFHATQELYEKQLQLLDNGLQKQYHNSFNKTMYDYQTGLEIGVSFTRPNKEAIQSAIREKWCGDNYSDRLWANRDKLSRILQTEIPRMFALGENPIKAAKRMRDQYEPRFAGRTYKDKDGEKKRLTSWSERIARTEFIETANRASFDATTEMDNELGGDLFQEFEFVAGLDEKTCSICGELDGKRFPIEKKKTGENFPVLHPNCRCSHIIVINGQRISQRIARDPLGKSYYVRGNTTYDEWWASHSDETKLEYKIARNAKADAATLKEFQKRLGRNGALKSKAEFQRVKYYQPDEWKALKNQYRQAKPRVLTNAAGKEIIEVKKTTATNTPNTITQLTGRKGGIERNYYREDGKQIKQVSNNNHDKPKQHPYGKKGEHAHDYTWTDDGTSTRTIRELTDAEREENADIL